MAQSEFNFQISLSVINHLGRHLYRSFATVLGEAISNSWDADANNVWIYIDKEKNSFLIKDDGNGMNAVDFQNKFLKVGYTKRNSGNASPKGRPYIGRKGIGKLALLSCARKISIISKTVDGDYVNGTIDNSGLDAAIKEDTSNYTLEKVDIGFFKKYTKDHKKGTIIHFDHMNEGIKNSLDYLRKIIALYFRFSLIDKSFNIYLDGKKITPDDLQDLADKTEFLWNINNLKDPFTEKNLKFRESNIIAEKNLLEPTIKIVSKEGFRGFIASVRLPRDLKIQNTDEKIGVDLFVNGRLRERDILKHIPTAKVVESYLYGQIHFDGLDDHKDRFSTSREGIVANDEKFQELLENLKKIITKIIADWDKLRRKHHKEGDPENESIPKGERKAEELYFIVSKDFKKPHRGKIEKTDEWFDELAGDARYNFPSYAECFISENLVRKHIKNKKIKLSPEAEREILTRKDNEKKRKSKGNISIEIRKKPSDLSYLSMDYLANLVDKKKDHKDASLVRDANEYKPIRDALMHTALLSDSAKHKLTAIRDNIKGRVKDLLSKS